MPTRSLRTSRRRRAPPRARTRRPCAARWTSSTSPCRRSDSTSTSKPARRRPAPLRTALLRLESRKRKRTWSTPTIERSTSSAHQTRQKGLRLRSEPFTFVSVVAYFRSRRRVWPAVGLLVGLIVIAFDLWRAAPAYVANYAVVNDFRLAYAAATVGVHSGYGHLYDLAAQKLAIESLGAGFNPQPFISPPPLAWLVTPLLLFPFEAALVAWTVLLIAALVWTWFLLAPGTGYVRAAHLALMLGVFPVAFGVMVGQPGAWVAAAVATAWWLIRHDRAVWAGVVLSLVVLKPQLALLVPVCLLVSGHARTFGAWFVATVFIGLVALALLGPEGVARYRDVLAQTQTPHWDITRRYSISGPLGLGPTLTDPGRGGRDCPPRGMAAQGRRPG